ncbi:protein of unknown function [Cupriavidus neocaledonicus]|uniref:Uncharacterized protein n=1 Tax=Cupriavidus neocaledonicus TaxID=1040979 RepID=A0A375H6H9_9BURK|nr:protein of unknown function [Cupriavidus neocaledonicus]
MASVSNFGFPPLDGRASSKKPGHAPGARLQCPMRTISHRYFFAMQQKLAARRNKSGTFWLWRLRQGSRPNHAFLLFSKTYPALAYSSQICLREQKPGTEGKSETRAANTLARVRRRGSVSGRPPQPRAGIGLAL